jgi:hypothetical protein
MRDLEGLRMRIDGEYNDVFLYGEYLFLLSDQTKKYCTSTHFFAMMRFMIRDIFCMIFSRCRR